MVKPTFIAIAVCFLGQVSTAQANPLPDRDGVATIPAQEWPYRPGPRQVRVYLHYPGGSLKNVGPKTGLMLSLHNWGGTGFNGAPNPLVLAKTLNVVAIGVDYLQSGQKDSIEGPEPYDFGWLQGLDALRALHLVHAGLKEQRIPFDNGRIFATGGSGGGNVTLMVNKLAPRTFTCVVDLCGMARLSDDIAFNLPGGSDLNARYSRNPLHRNYLSPDDQQIRDPGLPQHLTVMKSLGSTGKIIVVHGIDDVTCPFADARDMVAGMKKAGLDVEPHFVTKAQLDGKVFTSSGHALGDRTAIVLQVAGKYLRPGDPGALVRGGPTDFERRQDVRFATRDGQFIVSYAQGFPVGRFEPTPPPIYKEHLDLTYYLMRDGKSQPIRDLTGWEVRRRHALAGMQQVMGPLPPPAWRVPLDIEKLEETKVGDLVRRKISYRTDPFARVSAWLFLPASKPKSPAILCLHQTTNIGKDEPAGLGGHPSLHYALHLAKRGFITLAPDYPSFGAHRWDFADPKHGYRSGTMKAIWDNIRAVDLLQSLPEVDGNRLGVIGHSLGGHNALFTAAFEPRLVAIVSSCGFTSFLKDDMPSWTGPRYMPRITSVYKNDARRMPFDFTEIVAALAPRPFLACAATKDNDFDVAGVRDVMTAARPIYDLHKAGDRLQAFYPEAPHSFPDEARQRAFEFLERALR